jgi:hypothetical protein
MLIHGGEHLDANTLSKQAGSTTYVIGFTCVHIACATCYKLCNPSEEHECQFSCFPKTLLTHLIPWVSYHVLKHSYQLNLLTSCIRHKLERPWLAPRWDETMFRRSRAEASSVLVGGVANTIEISFGRIGAAVEPNQSLALRFGARLDRIRALRILDKRLLHLRCKPNAAKLAA